MGYFEKLFFGNAFPLDEIQDELMSSDRGKELTALLSKTSRILKDTLSGETKEAFETYRDTQDTIIELLQIATFKSGFSYGAGLMQEIGSMHSDQEIE